MPVQIFASSTRRLRLAKTLLLPLLLAASSALAQGVSATPAAPLVGPSPDGPAFSLQSAAASGPAVASPADAGAIPAGMAALGAGDVSPHPAADGQVHSGPAQRSRQRPAAPAAAPAAAAAVPAPEPATDGDAPTLSVYGFIPPERTVNVAASNRDVNRIHCSEQVDDVFFSKEKPVDVQTVGGDVFVKMQTMRLGEREMASKEPIDLHVVCGGEVYTMILRPAAIDSVTLRLGDPTKDRAVQVAKEWGSLPIEDKVQRFTRMVYRDELPPTFHQAPMTGAASEVRQYKNLVVRGVRRITAPGLGLAAVEYEVTALNPVSLDERDFLNYGLSKSIVGITVDPLTLAKPYQTARLILIERSVGDVR
jgi:hypothetical protein